MAVEIRGCSDNSKKMSGGEPTNRLHIISTSIGDWLQGFAIMTPLPTCINNSNRNCCQWTVAACVQPLHATDYSTGAQQEGEHNILSLTKTCSTNLHAYLHMHGCSEVVQTIPRRCMRERLNRYIYSTGDWLQGCLVFTTYYNDITTNNSNCNCC